MIQNITAFGDLLELRKILSAYSDAELATIWPDDPHGDGYRLIIEEENLSDRSIVQNFTIEPINK